MAVNNAKLSSAMAEADAKYGKWAWDYMVKLYKSWATLKDVQNAMKNYNSKSTTSTPTYTNYTKLTNKTPTKDWTPSSTGNTNYVKDAWYWSAGNNWNKKMDITSNTPEAKARANEIISHIKADQKTNPGLFAKGSRADFDKYYDYANSDPSQQALLDELYDNANKYWLDSYQNLTADEASQVIMDANKQKKELFDTYYNNSKNAANIAKQSLDDRLKPLFNEIQAMQAQWLNDFSELRDMQKQYYANVKKEYDAAKAGESASLVSQLSWQGLASGIIGNAVAWQDKVWWTRYNELMRNHIDTLKELTDKTAAFMNNIWNTKNNLTRLEKEWLDDWVKNMTDLDKQLYDTYSWMVDDEYSPYKAATQSKVEGMNEWLQTQWKRDAKTSDYKSTNDDNWIQQMTNDIGAQLQITDAGKMWKLYQLATKAASMFNNNPTEAKAWIYQQLWITPTSWAKKSTGDKGNNNFSDDEWFKNWWWTYSEYVNAGWKLSELDYANLLLDNINNG